MKARNAAVRSMATRRSSKNEAGDGKWLTRPEPSNSAVSRARH